MNNLTAGISPCTDTLCLTVLNHDTGQPSIYIGQTTVLDVSIVNNTGSDIALQSGSPAAELDIFFLSLSVDLNDCHISLPGWTMKAGSGSLALAYTATAPGAWAQGDALSFQITGVQSSVQQAVAGFFQVNFTNMSSAGNALGRRKMPLVLLAAPQNGNAPLDKIHLSLDNDGIIYVTPSGSGALENTLFLNITNCGDEALFTGSIAHQGKPQIQVYFIYGSTPGSLAPDIDKKQPDSAWLIKSGLKISQGNDWVPTDPDPSGTAVDPIWVITPGQNNVQLIGTGDASSVKFSFNHVVSPTSPGITQMYVFFSGFLKDDNVKYDNALFVLNINKQAPPVDQGIVFFSSPDDTVTATSPHEPVFVNLNWALTFAASVKIDLPGYTAHLPKRQPFTQIYGSEQPLVTDAARIPLTVGNFQDNVALEFKMWAYDQNGNAFPKTQSAFVELEIAFFQDSDNQVYPLVSLDTAQWMAANWNFDAGADSMYYNNNMGNAAQFGRLYTWQGIKNLIPEGWRLPTIRDWQNLINFYGSMEDAYAALMPGGGSGFEAQLGGFGDTSTGPGSPYWADLGADGAGYYWTGNSDPAGDTADFVKFSSSSKEVFQNSQPWSTETSWLSCRFVRDK